MEKKWGDRRVEKEKGDRRRRKGKVWGKIKEETKGKENGGLRQRGRRAGRREEEGGGEGGRVGRTVKLFSKKKVRTSKNKNNATRFSFYLNVTSL